LKTILKSLLVCAAAAALTLAGIVSAPHAFDCRMKHFEDHFFDPLATARAHGVCP